MTWFKVDDGFYTNQKIEGLSMAARGLWVTAGSYCGHQLTDGIITARMVRQLGGTPTQIRALIEHELWCETHDDSGAKAYAFKDWSDFNPSREDELNRRAREREKKREWREQKAAKQGQRQNVPGGQDAGRTRGRTEDVPGSVPGVVPLYPTRPDPTRPDQLKEGGKVVREVTGGERDNEPPSLIPDEWLGNPRLARCAAHAGIDDPPPCVGCRDARRAAEEAGHARAREQMGRAAAVKAERDACDLCDPAGFILDVDDAIRCTHDPDRNGEAVLAADTARREREAEEQRIRETARAAVTARKEVPRGPF